MCSCAKCSRGKKLKCQAFADDVETKVQQQSQPEQKRQLRNPFQGYSQQPDGVQKFLGETPKVALILMAVAGVGASGLLGSLIGSQAPAAQRAVARALGAAVASGAALFGVKKLKEKRESAAVLALYHTLASHPDLASLSAAEIKGVGEKYSVDLAKGRVAEMKQVYDTFVESVIPVEGQLEGDEVEKIVAFKDALGLAPEDAAAAHMDVGRRFQRLANESSKATKGEYRKALNKLIYVSGLVFGERQEAFLLPWKRVCGYSNESLIVAKRDQAKALFKNHMDAIGEGVPANEEVLAGIRKFQERLRLDPSLAQETIKESSRAYVEAHLEAAIQCLKQRGRVRDLKPLLEEVRAVIDYSLDLEELADKPGMPQGLGKVTIHGGAVENRSRDLRDVFRTYLEEQLRIKKGIDDDLEDDLTDLQAIMGLGKKEAADIISEVTSKAYRALLREAVSSGRLDQATSKADVLAEMCDSLNFDPDAASALHKQLYRQKIDSLLEKKHLTDADAADLDRQRRLLCIKKADVQQVHRDTCGRIYQEAVEHALNAGHEKFTGRDRDAVKKAMHAVRLDDKLAKEILSSTVTTAFMGFITRSRNKPNKLEAAKELKALVYFSNMVVTPLLEDINAISKSATEAAQKELAEIMVQAKEAAEKEEAAEKAKESGEDSSVESRESDATSGTAAAVAEAGEGGDVPETLRKSEAGLKKEAEASTSGKGMGSQKEITLREQLDSRDRLDIYRNFLHYCMSGNIVALPMGTSVQVQRDESEFARLSNLGDILGLSPMEINSVHQGLAEQAFRQQVQATTAGGSRMTAEAVKDLEEKRVQFGLSEAAASKIIKGLQNQNVIANMNAQKAQGGLTVQQLLDMREQGININDVTSEELRGNLYTKELLDALTNGSGDFDRERFLVELPEKLEIKERRVRSAVDTSAKERKRATLVQGVSYLRQKDVPNVVKNLNNLLSCHKALPSDKPEEWQPREEAQDLWSVYITKESDSEKQQELARILDIPPQEQDQLRSLVQSGEFKLEGEDQAEGDIF